MLRDEIFGLGSCIAKYIVFVFNVIFAVSTMKPKREQNRTNLKLIYGI